MIFKQLTAIMLGLFLVFGSIFFALRAGITSRLSTISESYVSEMDEIFDASAEIGKSLAQHLGEENFSLDASELPILLERTLRAARESHPEILALVAAFEPKRGSEQEKMLLARASGDKIEIIEGFGYSRKDWYMNARDTGRGIWNKPFIGDFIKEPLMIYSLPFYVSGDFRGVVCVDISLGFLHTQEFSANQNFLETGLIFTGLAGFALMGVFVLVISSRFSRPLMEYLKKLTVARDQIEGELKVAREIQMGILPKILPPFPKCELFEIDAFLTPAREVGGDLYDFFFMSPEKLCVVIGDVSGKGVPASLFMAVTQTLHRGLAHEGNTDPADIVKKINRSLFNNNSGGMFVTYTYSVIDFSRRTMTYCNAGHNPFFLIKSDGTVSSPCERHGIPLGVRENRDYGKSELKLEGGDTLFFYTDGITEAKDEVGEFFGNERLISVLENAARENENLSPKGVNEKIRSALANFVGSAEQFDDITAVTLKIAPLTEGGQPP